MLLQSLEPSNLNRALHAMLTCSMYGPLQHSLRPETHDSLGTSSSIAGCVEA